MEIKNILVCGKPISNAGHSAEEGIIAALKRIGYHVDIFDYGTKGPIESLEKKHDLVICMGAGIPDGKADYKLVNKVMFSKSILWNSEPIRLSNYYDKVKRQKSWFDVHASFDAGEIPLYEKMGCKKVVFLPQAGNPEWYKPLDVEPTKFCCFMGSVGGKWRNRQAFLNRIKNVIPANEITLGVDFNADNVNKIYNDHKLVLNLGLYHENLGPPEYLDSYGLQQRIFESYCAGTPCFTNLPADWQTTPNTFENHKDIIFYTNSDLEAILKYYCENQNKLNEIRDNIRSKITKHTYEEHLRHFFCLVINNELWSE